MECEPIQNQRDKPITNTRSNNTDNELLLVYKDSDVQEALERIINGGPWVYRNSWLILHRWRRDWKENPIDFNTVNIWVQLWGVPSHCKSQKMALKIGSSIGQGNRLGPWLRAGQSGKCVWTNWGHTSDPKQAVEWNRVNERKSNKVNFEFLMEKLRALSMKEVPKIPENPGEFVQDDDEMDINELQIGKPCKEKMEYHTDKTPTPVYVYAEQQNKLPGSHNMPLSLALPDPHAIESDEKQELDRAFGNQGWCDLFPSHNVLHLPPGDSDHLHVLVDLDHQVPLQDQRRDKQKIFQFEQIWTIHDDCSELVKNSWMGFGGLDSVHPLSGKLSVMAEHLSKWNREKFGYVGKRLLPDYPRSPKSGEVLPVRSTLVKRGMDVADVCPLGCSEEVEFVVHALVGCPCIRPFWCKAEIPFTKEFDCNILFIDWFSCALNMWDAENLMFFSICCYNLWHRRNDVRLEISSPSLD
ncbi:cysteine desulfurase mitochondrial-like [Senna tora]|uniref:Cysteine desulfurase mitochondrial-like n=1 Tax=Senna tora TaxID=362788 RepID=A0A834T081_9FABA|nr:cysteine desulfurase mitochondrial-like [Senna tora]